MSFSQQLQILGIHKSIMSYQTCIQSISHIILVFKVYAMCQICLQNKETVTQEQTVNQESYTILSLYIPISAWSIFSIVLSLMQPERVLWRVLYHLGNNIVSCTFSWLKKGLS